jgi:hypothetical protein
MLGLPLAVCAVPCQNVKVAPKHGNPRFKFSVLLMKFADTPASFPGASVVGDYYGASDSPVRQFLGEVSGGCFDYEIDAYTATLAAIENEGGCRTQPEEFSALDMTVDEAAMSETYDATHLIVAQSTCGTSGSMGSQSFRANGVNRTATGIFMSVSAEQLGGHHPTRTAVSRCCCEHASLAWQARARGGCAQ